MQLMRVAFRRPEEEGERGRREDRLDVESRFLNG